MKRVIRDLCQLALLATGLASFIAGLNALGRDDYVGGGICFLAAAVAIGIVYGVTGRQSGEG